MSSRSELKYFELSLSQSFQQKGNKFTIAVKFHSCPYLSNKYAHNPELQLLQLSSSIEVCLAPVKERTMQQLKLRNVVIPKKSEKKLAPIIPNLVTFHCQHNGSVHNFKVLL